MAAFAAPHGIAANRFTGTSSNDTINANAGVDVVYGLIGDDDIDGGAGNDTIYGGTDDDEITGGAGDDTLYGGSLVTAAGACTVTDTGIDEVDGGDDNDTVFGGNNNSVTGAVCADTGADTVTGGAGTDTVYGGNNNAQGATGNDAGDTLVDGGAGSVERPHESTRPTAEVGG